MEDTSVSDAGLLILRLVVGLYVAGHGAQKLFGWFDGNGLQAATTLMGSHLRLRPAPFWTTVLAASELIAGVLMALGLLGPLGPLTVAGAMLGAAIFGHWSNGPWSSKGGYELAATNLAVALGVALLGVGRFSVDAWIGLTVPQSASAVFAVLVALGVLAAGLSRGPTPVQEQSPTT
jgi:putative oxidoreductase